MPQSINRIAALLLTAFMVLSGALGFWSASGPSLTAREDNPRRILAERRILRGSIVDRDGEVIVETIGEPGAYARRSRYPYAAPFAGYYSINYGTSGVEQAFDAALRGTLDRDAAQAEMDELLHISPIGRAARLTIDLDVQRAADALLADRAGAIVVLSVPDGDLLALSSHPTFDPNTLDENWDRLREDPTAPLLNRGTQGEYQPGTILQSILLSEAIIAGVASVDDTPDLPTRALAIDSESLTCLESDEVVTLADAYRSACPAPFADLGTLLGGDVMREMSGRWGLTETNVVGVQNRPPITQSTPLSGTQALREFAVGQGDLTVTPLQMAMVAGALATRGEIPMPRIVAAIESSDGAWQAADQVPARRVAPIGIILQVVAAMHHEDDMAWHAGIGVSGSSRQLWFLGFTPIVDPQFAAAVLIEQDKDVPGSRHAAIEVGKALLDVIHAQ